MPEGGPHNEEYTRHHPDAIVDRDKAELVGHATKPHEEAIIRDASQADAELDTYAEKLGQGDRDSAEYAKSYAQGRLDSAASHRKAADRKATAVSEAYDETMERIAALKKGKISSPQEAAPESTEVE